MNNLYKKLLDAAKALVDDNYSTYPAMQTLRDVVKECETMKNSIMVIGDPEMTLNDAIRKFSKQDRKGASIIIIGHLAPKLPSVKDLPLPIKSIEDVSLQQDADDFEKDQRKLRTRHHKGKLK